MRGPGIPETVEEVTKVVRQVAGVQPGTPSLPNWPYSQIVALAQAVENLGARVEQLEAAERPRRGRPPKDPTVDLVNTVAERA